MFDIGDEVVAIRNGGKDRRGRPHDRPVKGEVYRITGIYRMSYGLGCTLEGLDPSPYRGFFLVCRGELYFRKLVKDTQPATAEEGSLDILKKLREKETEDA